MASGSLGSLVVSMAVDTAKFQGDLGRAAAITERRMKNIRDTATRAFAALTFAATTAGAALVAAVGHSLRDADQLLELAKSVGTTVEQLSALRYAAGLAGVSQEELGIGLKKLAVSAVAASNGVASSAGAFKALGISVERSNGSLKSVDELVGEIATAFAAAPDSVTKTALAVDLFGKSGAKLIPLLNEGSKGIDALKAEAEKLGLVIDTKTAVAADNFNDNLTRLKGVAAGFSNLIAADIAPTLANFTAELVNSAGGANTLRDSAHFLGNLLRGLLTIVELVRFGFSEFGKTLGGLAASLVQFAQGEFKQAWDTLKEISDDGAVNLEREVTRLLDIWDETANQTASAAPKLGADLAAPVVEAAKLSKEAVAEMERYLNQATQMRIDAQRLQQPLAAGADNQQVADDINASMEKIRKSAGGLADDVGKASDALKEGFGQMSVYADQAARNMQDAFADFLFDPFDRGIKGMLKGFIDILRRMVAEAAAAKIFEALGFGQGGAGGGGGGGGGIFASILGSLFGAGAPGSTPTVPPIGGGGSNFAGLFAGGGRLNPGEWGIVGDQGPELAFGGAHGQTIMPMGKAQPAQKIVNITLSPTTNVHVDSRADRAAVRQETIAIVSEGNRQMFEALRDARSRGQF